MAKRDDLNIELSIDINKSIANVNDAIKKIENDPKLKQLNLKVDASQSIKKLKTQLKDFVAKATLSDIKVTKKTLNEATREIRNHLKQQSFNVKVDLKLGKTSETIKKLQTKFKAISNEFSDDIARSIQQGLNNARFDLSGLSRQASQSINQGLEDSIGSNNTSRRVQDSFERTGDRASESFSRGFRNGSMRDLESLKEEFSDLGRSISENLSSGAKITTTAFSDAEGRIKRLVVQGKEANGEIKKLNYSIKDIHENPEDPSSNVIGRSANLLSMQELDNSEEMLERFEDKYIKTYKKLSKYGERAGGLWDTLALSNNIDDLKMLDRQITMFETELNSNEKLLDIDRKRKKVRAELIAMYQSGYLKDDDYHKKYKGIDSLDDNGVKDLETELAYTKKTTKAVNDRIAEEERLRKLREKNKENLEHMRAVLGTSIMDEKEYHKIRKEMFSDSNYNLEKQIELQKELSSIEKRKSKFNHDVQAEKLKLKLLKEAKELEIFDNQSVDDKDKLGKGGLADLYKKLINEAGDKHDDLKKLEANLSTEVEQAKRLRKSYQRGTRLNATLSDDQKEKLKNIARNGSFEEAQDFFKEIYGDNAILTKWGEENDDFGKKIRKWNVELQDGKKTVDTFNGSIHEMNEGLYQASKRVVNNANKNLGVIEQLKIALQRVPVWAVATTAIYGTQHALQQMVQTLFELDAQMTELKRVMSADTDFNSMLEESIALSKELGNNVRDVNEAMIGFARQGFNPEEALALTKTATVASNVSELKAGEAMESITASMKQFNIEAQDSISIVDKLNEVNC